MGGQAQLTAGGFSANLPSTAAWNVTSPNITMSANTGAIKPGFKVKIAANGIQIGIVKSFVGTALVLTANPALGGATGTLLTFTGDNYTFASNCKMIHDWRALDGTYIIAYLCESNLYVDVGGVLTDITPIGGIVAPSGITGGYGDGNYNEGTYGTPRPLPSNALVTKIPDAYSLDNFGSILYAMTSSDSRLLTWDPGIGAAGIVATSLTANPFTNTTPNISMTIANPGTVKPGMSVYSTTFGTFVGTVLTYVGTALVLTANAAIGSGGALYNLNFGNFAIVQPAAAGRGPVPHGRCFVVTPDRFVMIFGSTQDGTTDGGSARRFAWCDQENPGAWDYGSVTSQAGFFDVEPASPIVCALSSRVGVIFWTAKKVYAAKFLGLPYVYNYTELADGTTPWSPQSMATTSSLSLWMSEQGVFSYDGTSVLPVQCLIRPWIDDDFDIVNVREQAFACHLAEFNEWWWFFPQSGQLGNTRAAVYNYKEGWWTQVRMSRSAGISSNYAAHPIFTDNINAFQHETGTVYANSTTPVQLPFAETFDLNLTSGALLITIKQMLPDVDGDIDNLLYSLFYRNSRSLGLAELQSNPVSVRSDGYVDFRVTGRDVRLRIDVSTTIVQHFTLGQHLIDAVTRGDR